jgi:crossover junction endodeoxyribonuclease RuvC
LACGRRDDVLGWRVRGRHVVAEMSIVLGIDIGVTGALAAIDNRGSASVADLPTVEVAGKRTVKRAISGRGLLDLLRHYVPPGEPCLAVIEDIRGGFGPGGHASLASVMHSRGVVEAVLSIARADVLIVQPQVWQRAIGMTGGDKAASRQLAMQKHPLLSSMLSRVKDHNRADALHLAEYGARSCR